MTLGFLLVWSLLPNNWNRARSFVWNWNSDNADLVDNNVDGANAVRPAISLKSCTKWANGDGSSSNPYTIQETETGC